MKIVPDWLAMQALPRVEDTEVYVEETNLRFRLMAGAWICIGVGRPA